MFATVRDYPQPSPHAVELSIVLPTFQERDNVPRMIAFLDEALGEIKWEAVFVDDDSPDQTAEVVREFAQHDSRIRLLHRVGRRGLSSACVEGILASSADWVAVMDADLQHDAMVLPAMLEKARAGSLDLVIGTRNAAGGSMGDFRPHRVLLSKLGQKISHTICREQVSDPMSGFFVARRGFVLECAPRLQRGGFKILVDLFASSRNPVRFAEVGYTFRERQFGSSKLDLNTAVEYMALIVSKFTGDLLPTQLIKFGMVGTIGLITHLCCLAFLLSQHNPFRSSEIIATYIAMVANFCLNNSFTYRDCKLRGRRFFIGLASFCVACSFGAWGSVVFARALLQSGTNWYLAGAAGLLISFFWNYCISSLFTWQTPPRPIALERTSPAFAREV